MLRNSPKFSGLGAELLQSKQSSLTDSTLSHCVTLSFRMLGATSDLEAGPGKLYLNNVTGDSELPGAQTELDLKLSAYKTAESLVPCH